ncbi:Caleosin related protein-domain-containing protein [Scleroderma citrinum]
MSSNTNLRSSSSSWGEPPYVAPRVPVTRHRPPRTDTEDAIDHPYVPRASRAASFEQPNGTDKYSDHYHEYSVMQQHCLYWDRDGDGIIWPKDTWLGFRDLGFNVVFTILAVVVIHSALSLPTRLPVSYFPDPLFRIYVDHIHKGKHGSDSGVFDSYGRFIPSRFEDIWAEFTRRGMTEPPRTKMTLGELWEFVSANRVVADPFGWVASAFEWLATFLLVQQKGEVDKDDVRKIMDGSLFFEIRDARQTKAGWNKGWGLGGDGFIGDEKVSYFGSGL